MIATKAFGMGIDKPNIRFTLHYSFPSSVESFYQEAGRAGRDGRPAVCGILYHERDIETNQDFQQNSFKGVGRERTVLTELLEEVHYEDRFFLRQVERELREELEIYVRLNLFPVEKPFLMYVNGKWHEDPDDRTCYGCLHLRSLKPFKPGKYRTDNVSDDEVKQVLYAVQEVVRERSDTSDYAEYLARTEAPGILTEILNSAPGTTKELVVGFTSDTVQKMTARLEELGLPEEGKNYEIKDEVVRAAYNFSHSEDKFIEQMKYKYKKYFKQREKEERLHLDAETKQFFQANYLKIRNPTDTQRALYRLSILGIVDDYDIDYANQAFIVRFRGKSDEYYRERLDRYFRRYLGEDSTKERLRRVDDPEDVTEDELIQTGDFKEPSMIKRCLWAQIDFVYDEIDRKRKRAIHFMDGLCKESIARGKKSTQEGDEYIRQSIVYYFTSKYARDEYLPGDLDKGKIESLDIVAKYIDYVFNPPDGLGGQIDNAKHLRGACARLQTSLTGENAVIDVLNAFSILVMDSVKYEDPSGVPDEPSEEAIASYRRGFGSFLDRSLAERPTTSWDELLRILDQFHEQLSGISSDIERSIRPEREALLIERTTWKLAKFNQAMQIS